VRFLWVLILCLASGGFQRAQASEEEVKPITLTKPPQLLEFVQAPYPEAALKAQKESVVVMAIDVDAEGIVQQVKLLQSGGREFDQAAMAAAAGFRFVPAEAGELGPVPVRITYRYKFAFEAPPEKVRTSTPTKTKPLPINFYGVIREAGSRLPLNLSTVHLIPTSTNAVRTSTETTQRGRFAFRGVIPGEYRVEVAAPFFTRLKVEELITVGEALEVVYFVRRKAKNPYEIVVRGLAPRKEVARRTLQLEEVQRIPGSQGDAIRVVQNMPGVARTPFGIGLLVVRGSPPQDTGVFLDGQRIPSLFHFGGIGGLTSVIHSSILEEINFMPGGFGPQYGLVSAGAVELKSRAPKNDRVRGEAKLDMLTLIPTNVSVLVEGPVTEDPNDGAFLFSLRRSAIDGVFAAATEIFDLNATLAPRYYDYTARYDVPIKGDNKRSLTLFTYGSDDELILVGDSEDGDGGAIESRTQFHRFNPRYTYRADEDTELQISPILGVDISDTKVPGGMNTREDIQFKAQAYSAGLLIHGTTRLAPWLKLRTGGDLFYFAFESQSVLPGAPTISNFPGPGKGPPATREDSVVMPLIASSVFSELEIQPFSALTLWPGARIQILDYQAEDQPLIDPRLLEGRTVYEVDPRLTARFQLLDRLSFKGQAGQYSQPALPHQVYLNADLPFQKVEQYSGGFDLDIVDRLTLDIQGFYRFGYDIAAGTSDVEVVNGRIRPVAFRPTGERRAYGMELFLRLENRWDFFGWVAYTLSRAETKNQMGEWQTNYVFDQTHNLNFVGVYEFAFNWYLGARFRYVTGGGLPKTVQRWYDADEDGYDRRIDGEERAPPFHQLDIYLEKRWTFEQWYLEFYVDVQNVYNHSNTEFYVPSFDYKTQEPVPGLPILPSFGLKGVF